jgi:hypothetical protein
VGQGSADKAGCRGSEHLHVGVEKLIGVRVIHAGNFTLAASTGTVTFPTTLPGANADYIVVASAAHAAWGTSVTTTGFTLNGTSADVVSYIVIRVDNATVTVG